MTIQIGESTIFYKYPENHCQVCIPKDNNILIQGLEGKNELADIFLGLLFRDNSFLIDQFPQISTWLIIVHNQKHFAIELKCKVEFD